MPSVLLGLLVLFAAWGARAAEPAFTISDEFVRYIESATNPEGFGLGKDGRFKPYSTPLGRRIGYSQPVWDEALYAEGCTQAEAGARLRLELQRTLADVRSFLATNTPAYAFEKLSPASQEILVDLASSEGVRGLKPETVAAVVTADWQRLLDGMLYIRMFGATLDNLRNRAFAKRWIASGRLAEAKPAAQSGDATPLPAAGFMANMSCRISATLNDAVCVVPLPGHHQGCEFRPRFTVFVADQDPQLALRWGDWGDPAERHLYNVLTWSTGVVAKAEGKLAKGKHVEDGFDPTSDQSKDAGRTMNAFRAARSVTLDRAQARYSSDKITWLFPEQDDFSLLATLELPAGACEQL